MNPTIDDVQVVLARFEDSEWDELRIDAPEFHLHVCKSPRAERPTAPAALTAPAAATLPAAPATHAAAADSGAISAPSAADTQVQDGVVVRAPSLGTFYRAPKPGSDPYVEVGSTVAANSQLALLEVMKLYTAVEAGTEGVVVQILVEDGALVEHDEPLFVIRPVSV